jgi:DNA repair protein RecO (recombination protein O)
LPTYNCSGIVVHRVNLSESDKILTIYSREHGKLSAVAKGARRPGSRLSGATELFVSARFLLATGKSLDVISQCEVTDVFPDLRGDLGKLARATYMCELLDRLTLEHDATSAADLFDLTLSALRLLQQAHEYPDAIVHAYELNLVAIQGYAPVLDRCVRCGEPLPRGPIGFSPSLGGSVCNADRRFADDTMILSPEAVAMLRTFAEGETLALLSLCPAPGTAGEAARALRWHLRYRVEREIKSAEFLDQLRATGA